MENISPALLNWFYENQRVLPFRTDPSPYHVWLSEIMLQQTRVSAALPYYERFLAALPDIPALAACEEEKLNKLWEGLGYYSSTAGSCQPITTPSAPCPASGITRPGPFAPSALAFRCPRWTAMSSGCFPGCIMTPV